MWIELLRLVPTVNNHLANLLVREEITDAATVHKFRIVQVEGNREVFLDEVVKVVRAMAKDGVAEESNELLNTMIDGHRLRDLSDLPLDLAV